LALAPSWDASSPPKAKNEAKEKSNSEADAKQHLILHIDRLDQDDLISCTFTDRTLADISRMRIIRMASKYPAFGTAVLAKDKALFHRCSLNSH
jgi:hypothetical protein